jgi:serine phosphatase RsbU (regulator of sigma subunit)
MERLLLGISTYLSPGIKTESRQAWPLWRSDAIGLLYSVPLALAGLAWLVVSTDIASLRLDWLLLLLVFILVFLFRQLSFFAFAEIKTGRYAEWSSTLDPIASWSAVLLIGPIALWPILLYMVIHFSLRWPDYAASKMQLNRARLLSLDIADQAFMALVTKSIYTRAGGVIPFPGLQLEPFLLALGATLLWYALSRLLWLPYFIHAQVLPALRLPRSERATSLLVILRLYTITEVLPAFIGPFAVLAAGLYSQYGLMLYLFIMIGMLLLALLANLLSKAAERSYHRSRELERLEVLSTAIINAPYDASTLPELLQEHVPGMFPDSQIEIRLFPNRTLLPGTSDWPAIPEAVWEWLSASRPVETDYFLRGTRPPWESQPTSGSLLFAPIQDVASGNLIGGICVEVYRWPPQIIPYFQTALQSLALQISSTLHQADVYAQTLLHERIAQELTLAGEIQTGLLPSRLPEIPGWEFAAAIEPSRETSGDFYDWFKLDDGRLGLLVADVADKGMGAALYMAMSRSIIHSYALEPPTDPAEVLRSVNQRLLADARIDMFITVFYGIIDPDTGRMVYCNAGHPPPILIQSKGQGTFHRLTRTGTVLGILEDAHLDKVSVKIEPGATLILYTDGITDAQNEAGDFYDDERLLDTLCKCQGYSAQEIQSTILEGVHAFAGEAPQADDITLFVVVRKPNHE